MSPHKAIVISALAFGILSFPLESSKLRAEESGGGQFKVGDEVIVNLPETDFRYRAEEGTKVCGTISKVVGDQYEVNFNTLNPAEQIFASTRTDVTKRELLELNTPTKLFSSGLLPGLHNIRFDPDGARFKAYVGEVDSIIKSYRKEHPGNDNEALQGLIKKILEHQGSVVTSTRASNGSFRRMGENRPERSIEDILAKKNNVPFVGDTFDASTLLFAVLKKSSAFKETGIRLQLLKTDTPAKFAEIVVRAMFPGGKSLVIDPVWNPPIQTMAQGIWPQRDDEKGGDSANRSRQVLKPMTFDQAPVEKPILPVSVPNVTIQVPPQGQTRKESGRVHSQQPEPGPLSALTVSAEALGPNGKASSRVNTKSPGRSSRALGYLSLIAKGGYQKANSGYQKLKGGYCKLMRSFRQLRVTLQKKIGRK